MRVQRGMNLQKKKKKKKGLSGMCWSVVGLITASDTLLSSHLCRSFGSCKQKISMEVSDVASKKFLLMWWKTRPWGEIRYINNHIIIRVLHVSRVSGDCCCFVGVYLFVFPLSLVEIHCLDCFHRLPQISLIQQWNKFGLIAAPVPAIAPLHFGSATTAGNVSRENHLPPLSLALYIPCHCTAEVLPAKTEVIKSPCSH